MTAVFVSFIALSAFCVVNMLIGILCNVVDRVAETERDEADVRYLKSTLLELLDCFDEDGDRTLTKLEFENLMRNPVTKKVLTRFGVDSDDLLSMKDSLYEHSEILSQAKFGARPTVLDEGGLSFAEFMHVVFR